MIFGQILLKKGKYGGHFEIQNGCRRRIRVKKWNQLRFCLQRYKDAKNIGSTSIGNFALDYITPCTINVIFCFLGQFTAHINFSKSLIILKKNNTHTKHAYIWLGVQYPLK